MQISDQTKAGIVDALGGVGVEMAKEFVLRQRQQQAMQERKEMEMELAETRARAMNQSSVDTTTMPDTESQKPQRSSAKLGGNGSFQDTDSPAPDTPSVSSELAQRVIQELSTKSQQQVGYREAKTFDNLVQQDVSTDVMRDAMEDFSVITPIIADVDV
jgi:hypothetical protein